MIDRKAEGINRKKVFRLAGVTDYKYLETKYKEMALKGWLVENIKGSRDTYVAVDPVDLDFSVTLFQHTGPLEYLDSNKEALYKELCEDGGWTYCTSNNRYQIYRKPAGVDAVPIHTDPIEEYNTIKNVFLKSEIFVPILMTVQFLYLLFGLKFMSYESFLVPGGLLSIFNPIFFIVIMSLYSTPVLIWFINNGQRVKRGETIVFESNSRIAFRNKLYVVLSCIYAFYILSSLGGIVMSGIPMVILMVLPVLIIIPLLVGFGLRHKIKKIRHSKPVNLLIVVVALIVTWVVMILIVFGLLTSSLEDVDEVVDGLPNVPILTYADFQLDLDFEPRRVNVQSSFLSPLNFTYNDRYHENVDDRLNMIDVEYIEMRFDWVTSMVVDMILNDEKEFIERENEYRVEAVDNYVYSIPGYENQVDFIYNLSSYKDEIMLIKGKIIYIVRLDLPIEGDRLKIIIDKIFGS